MNEYKVMRKETKNGRIVYDTVLADGYMYIGWTGYEFYSVRKGWRHIVRTYRENDNVRSIRLITDPDST